MFDTKSDYALNKRDPDAIVCKSVTGVHIRLTREDFETEEDFRTWKAWSDEDFHNEELDNHSYADNTISLESLPEAVVATPSPEKEMEQRREKHRRMRHTADTISRVKHILTERQYRRLWMYCVDGMTEQQIGDVEAVGQQRISKSIVAAENKIRKFFKRDKNRG